MVKEYLTNSVLPRDRAKADWVVTMSNHCILLDGVLWYKIKTKTRITMAVWAHHCRCVSSSWRRRTRHAMAATKERR
jgi:hypothetical protein